MYTYILRREKAEIKIENKEECLQQNENKCAHQTFEYADREALMRLCVC